MSDQQLVRICVPIDEVEITSLKVEEGERVCKGSALFSYRNRNEATDVVFKSSVVGVVKDVSIKTGTIATKQDVVMFIEQSCDHSVVAFNLCAICGIDLKSNKEAPGHLSMVPTIPQVTVSRQEAHRLGNRDKQQLLESRKLALIVDLDQTLVHTSVDHNIERGLPDVYGFTLTGHPYLYHCRLRPHATEFLNTVSHLFELHVFTMATKDYAHAVTKILDPKKKLFSDRVISRDECFDPHSKAPRLKTVFPCGDEMVAIIDDREDVWSACPNLVHVKPYVFFAGTSDINAPPPRHPASVAAQSSHVADKTNHPETRHPETHHPETRHPETRHLGETLQDSSNINLNNSTSTNTNNNNNNNNNNGGGSGSGNGGDPSSSSSSGSSSDSSSSSSDSESDSEEKTTMAASTTTTTNTTDEIMETGMEVDNSSIVPISDTPTDPSISDMPTDPSISDMPTDPSISDMPTDPSISDTPTDPSISDMPTDPSISDTPTDPSHMDVTSTTESSVADTKRHKPRKIEDNDNFLVHLGHILTRIHNTFYSEYDEIKKNSDQQHQQSNTIDTPDLNEIIPRLRKSVFSKCNILFSGVIPLGTPIERSREWSTARAFGGNVHTDIIKGLNSSSPNSVRLSTTHLVVGRPDTSKYRRARKIDGIKIVSSRWFWSSAEQWLKQPEEEYKPEFLLKEDESRIEKKANKESKAVSNTSSDRISNKRSKFPENTAGRDLRKNEKLETTTQRLYTRKFSVSSEELEKMEAEIDAELSTDESDSSSNNNEQLGSYSNREQFGSYVQLQPKDQLQSFDAYLGLEEEEKEFSRKRKRDDNEASSNSCSPEDDNSSDEEEDDELARLLMM